MAVPIDVKNKDGVLISRASVARVTSASFSHADASFGVGLLRLDLFSIVENVLHAFHYGK